MKGELFVSLFAPSQEISSLLIGQTLQIRKNSRVLLESTVRTARPHKKGLIIQLDNLEKRETAETYKEAEIFAPKQIFLPPKEKIFTSVKYSILKCMTDTKDC